jgi:N-acetylglucosaminyldiphosphoundecaprenol N-acetyl-beta-D-mannosaminyltransferase
MNQSATVKVFNLPFFAGTQVELVNHLAQHLTQAHSTQLIKVFTPNPEQVVYASAHSEFLHTLLQADYLIPDGSGIILASRWLSLKGKERSLPTRIAGIDVVADLLTHFSSKKVLLVGGQNYRVVEKHMLWSEIKVGERHVGWVPGYAQVQAPTPEEESTLAQVISKYEPDIIFVAFGAPYQEEWVIRHQKLLEQSSVQLVMVVGGAFDVLTGRFQRAPLWIQKSGLEWLYRLVQQPWRWKRQLQLLTFGWETVKQFFS